MSDRTVSATTVLAALLWTLAVALVVIGLALQRVGVGHMGILSAAAAATLTVRGYFVCLAAREHNAFLLGRDFEEGRVRSLR